MKIKGLLNAVFDDDGNKNYTSLLYYKTLYSAEMCLKGWENLHSKYYWNGKAIWCIETSKTLYQCQCCTRG